MTDPQLKRIIVDRLDDIQQLKTVYDFNSTQTQTQMGNKEQIGKTSINESIHKFRVKESKRL
jgi:hypothetical protein